jgi:hypothetical protein
MEVLPMLRFLLNLFRAQPRVPNRVVAAVIARSTGTRNERREWMGR